MSTFPDTLEQALLSSACHHAAVAMRDRESPDFHTRLGAAVSTGAAVELLLKHLLALKQPLYLQELKPKDVKTAWLTRRLLTGHSLAYSESLSDIKSVSAFEAVEMVPALYENLDLGGAPLRAALHVRNAAIHLAVLPSRDLMDDAAYAVVDLFTCVHDAGLIDALPFDDHPVMVHRFVKSYRERRAEHIKRKMAVAGQLADDFSSLTDDERSNIREDVSFFLDGERRTIVGEDEDSLYRGHARYDTQKCVVCQSDATVVCELTGEADVMEIDGQLREVGLTIADAFAFGCARCGLELSSTELRVLAESGNSWAAHLGESVVTSHL